MRTVIIVEDDADVALLQARLLEGLAEVRIIDNHFQRCFDPATWMHVDVAVVDLMLPGVMGEGICRFLQKQFPTVRRVICTAKPTYQLPELQEIADIVLQKPFSPNGFISAVLGGS